MNMSEQVQQNLETPKTRLAKALVELQVPEDWNDEEVIAQLADYGFVKAKIVREDPKGTEPGKPEFDSYGNRYDGKARAGQTHDAYGNAYDGSQAKKAEVPRTHGSHDAYGNPYKK